MYTLFSVDLFLPNMLETSLLHANIDVQHIFFGIANSSEKASHYLVDLSFEVSELPEKQTCGLPQGCFGAEI